MTEPTGDVKHYVCELSDFTKHAFATLKEYAAGIAAAVDAGKAAVDAAKGGDTPAMEPPAMDPPMEAMGEEMAPAEMMDPPPMEEGA